MPQPLLRNCFLHIGSVGALASRSSNVPKTGLNTAGDTLWFTNLPENVGTSKQANVTATNILGRSETIKTYGSSQGRAWNLDLHFFAEDPGKGAIRQAVVDKLNWCESLVYPIYANGLSQGIPRVLFKFGDYLSVMTICTSVTTNIAGPWSVNDTSNFVIRDGQINLPTGPNDTAFQQNKRGAQETLGDISLPLYGTVNLVLEDIGGKSWGHFDVKAGRHNIIEGSDG